jgi:sugar lactone lactonase YvrE
MAHWPAPPFGSLRRLGVGMVLVGLAAGAGWGAAPETSTPILREVARSDRQWTGIALSEGIRLFVNFPRWSPGGDLSVAQVSLSGEMTPYPDAAWNRWEADLPPADHFICVQSVFVDDNNDLWILDAANPGFTGVVPGGAKLLRADLKTDKIVQRILFDETVASKNSYLNDVRVDAKRRVAYITDSGVGALVVVDLKDGSSRRVLEGHPSTKAEAVTVTVEGREVKNSVHADGIALSPKGDWVYYQALTGRTLYRVPAKLLRDFSLPDERIAIMVERVAEVGPSDGLAMDDKGNLYLASIEKNAISRLDAKGNLSVLAQDEALKWPDSIALAPEGLLFVTTSQIHLGPDPPEPCRIYCIKYR